MKEDRLQKARTRLAGLGVSCLLVSDRDNVRWLTGFSGSNGVALLTPSDVSLFTDSRYTIQAGEEAAGADLYISSENCCRQAAELIREKSLGLTAFEADGVTFQDCQTMAEILGPSALTGVCSMFGELRAVKDADEIALLRRAAKVTSEAFADLLPHIHAGATERDVARELVYSLGKRGAEQESFPCIVAGGPRSALPHAKPSDRPLEAGEPVLMDFGALCGGYAGDITRTVFTGQPADGFRRVYDIVLEAQMAAIEAVRPGRLGCDVDAVARDIITRYGYGENFGHGLGHSLGLNVHDGPAFSPRSQLTLQPGMVVTVEPGIYVEGWGGVRIEDDVLVTEDGCEIITSADKRLLEL